ncbi:MAG: hypothetical protein ACOX3T_04800 [Bdellovibrionota bacterium]
MLKFSEFLLSLKKVFITATKHFSFPIFVIVFGVISIVYFSKYIPAEMDEHIQYWTFGCNYYGSAPKDTIYWKICSELDLAVLKDFFPSSPYLPLRSCLYLGSFGNVFFLPVWLLWKSIFSVRLVGFLMLGVQALIISKIFKLNKWGVFLFLTLFLQYSSQHVYDLGQLSFQCTSIFIIYYLLKKLFITTSSKKIYLYSFIIGLLAFIGIFIRLSYSFYYPALGILALLFMIKTFYKDAIKYKNFSRISKIFKGLIICFFTFLIPTVLLLTAKDKWNNYYFQIITKNTPSNAIYDIKAISKHYFDVLHKFVLDPTLTLSHEFFNYHATNYLFAFLNWLPIILLISYVIFSKRVHKNKKLLILFLIFLTLTTLYTISASPRSWAMHHVVLCYPFLLLAIFYSYKIISKYNYTIKNIFIITFSMSQCFLTYKFLHLEPSRPIDFALPTLIDTLDRYYSNQSLLIHTEWGGSFINSINNSNKDAIVMYVPSAPNRRLINNYINLAKQSGKNITIIGHKNSRKTKIYAKLFEEKNLKLITVKDPAHDLREYELSYVKVAP